MYSTDTRSLATCAQGLDENITPAQTPAVGFKFKQMRSYF